MKQTHKEALSVLIGLRLRKIGRAADLLWMHFGECRTVTGHRGNEREVGEWAFHLQTSWRFLRDGALIIEAKDMSLGKDAQDVPEAHPRIGQSRFDHLAVAFNEALAEKPQAVSAVSCDGFGGLSISFDGGLSFDALADVVHDTPGDELWRLFKPCSQDDHFVVETV